MILVLPRKASSEFRAARTPNQLRWSGREYRGDRAGQRHRVEVVRALGATLEAVNITEMRDGIYIAELVFGDERVVSARPSDAVALAVRTGAPIYGAEELLDEVGIEIPDEQEDEVEKFREFLDQISPEDFGAGSGSGG